MSKPTQKEIAKALPGRYEETFWDDLDPLADRKTLGLPADGSRLSGLASRNDFPRLFDALVRADIKKEREEILRNA